MLSASKGPGACGAAATAVAVVVVPLLLAVATARALVVEELVEHPYDARLDLITNAHLCGRWRAVDARALREGARIGLGFEPLGLRRRGFDGIMEGRASDDRGAFVGLGHGFELARVWSREFDLCHSARLLAPYLHGLVQGRFAIVRFLRSRFFCAFDCALDTSAAALTVCVAVSTPVACGNSCGALAARCGAAG